LETFAARSAAAFERELSPMAGVEDLLAALPTLRRFERPSGPRPPTACVDGAPAILRPARVQRLASRLRQAPDLFLFAAHQLGARPGDCTVVEDSVPGVEAAIAAQIRVVGFAVADTVRMIIPIG